MLSGILLDSVTHVPLQFAHVTNYSSKEVVLTNVDGRFNIPASAGDTVVFSIVGYERLGWQIVPQWLEDRVTFKLPVDAILLEDVIVKNMPTEAKFKQQILDTELADTTFWYHGMEPPKYGEDPMLNEKVIHNPLFIVTHPLTAIYYNFSKQEKERRKYHQITQGATKQNRVNLKFTREWVHDMTALEGDTLTAFIDYCDFTLDYLDRTPLYMIMEDMLAKLDEFQKGHQKG